MNFEEWSYSVLDLMALQFAKCKDEAAILDALKEYRAAWETYCRAKAQTEELVELSVKLHQLPIGRVRKSRAKPQAQKFDEQ